MSELDHQPLNNGEKENLGKRGFRNLENLWDNFFLDGEFCFSEVKYGGIDRL